MKKTASKATVIPTTQKRESTARTFSIMAGHALMLQCIPARTRTNLINHYYKINKYISVNYVKT
ncbi:TPA: hypothetical protein ACM7A2_004563, partial [Escherichia coli]